MHRFLWIVFIFSFNGSTCFGLSLVHHQEQHLISCTAQLAHAGTSSCCTAATRTACANCTVQLIKCCSWLWTNDSPKHGEPFNEKIKTIHKNLCISLVYIHITAWRTVHSKLKFIIVFTKSIPFLGHIIQFQYNLFTYAILLDCFPQLLRQTFSTHFPRL